MPTQKVVSKLIQNSKKEVQNKNKPKTQGENQDKSRLRKTTRDKSRNKSRKYSVRNQDSKDASRKRSGNNAGKTDLEFAWYGKMQYITAWQTTGRFCACYDALWFPQSHMGWLVKSTAFFFRLKGSRVLTQDWPWAKLSLFHVVQLFGNWWTVVLR